MCHQHGKGDKVQPSQGFGQALVIASQPPETRHPGKVALNGLITNDKFCLTRYGQLQLNWSRYTGYLVGKAKRAAMYPADEHAHLGGTDETPMASPPHHDDPCQRSTTLESGLSEPSAMDVSDAEPDGISANFQPGGTACE